MAWNIIIVFFLKRTICGPGPSYRGPNSGSITYALYVQVNLRRKAATWNCFV